MGISFFTPASRPALGPTQPPIQWVPGALSLGVKWPGREAITHLHLMPRSRMRGAIPQLPQYAFMAWCSFKTQGQLYLYLTCYRSASDFRGAQMSYDSWLSAAFMSLFCAESL